MARLLGNSGIEITPIIVGTWQAAKSGWVALKMQK